MVRPTGVHKPGAGVSAGLEGSGGKRVAQVFVPYIDAHLADRERYHHDTLAS